MKHDRLTRACRILSLFTITSLPVSLFCQSAPAKAQAPAPTHPSGSVMLLSFGPTASNPEGKAAADKLLLALGGADKVDEVKSVRQNVVALRHGERTDIEETVVYPDQQAQRMHLPAGYTLLVVTPSDAFTVRGRDVQNIPQAQRDALDQTLRHDFLNVLQHIHDPKYVFFATGQDKVNGVAATVVDVEANGVPTRWWIGADGKLLQERYSTLEQGGTATQTMIYSDWKRFGGIDYPTKYEMFNSAGQLQLTMTLTSMEVNPEVSPKLFTRPTE